jgi:hypothetical protein
MHHDWFMQIHIKTSGSTNIVTLIDVCNRAADSALGLSITHQHNCQSKILLIHGIYMTWTACGCIVIRTCTSIARPGSINIVTHIDVCNRAPDSALILSITDQHNCQSKILLIHGIYMTWRACGCIAIRTCTSTSRPGSINIVTHISRILMFVTERLIVL